MVSYDPKRGRRKLSESQVIEIKTRHINGETFRAISKDYPVNESNIRRACKGQAFSHII